MKQLQHLWLKVVIGDPTNDNGSIKAQETIHLVPVGFGLRGGFHSYCLHT